MEHTFFVEPLMMDTFFVSIHLCDDLFVYDSIILRLPKVQPI